mmetsp:Transcript_20135/g.65415  ORF Transcript_20135/g.65415 Transcript_20135/m.65415 type:complete len:116 (-) Transcript_20135:3481-3828(-)
MHAGGLACLLNLPLEVFTDMYLQPDLHDLVRVAECMRFRHDDDGLETVELSKTRRRLRRSASLRSLAPGWSEHASHIVLQVVGGVSGPSRAAEPPSGGVDPRGGPTTQHVCMFVL